MQLSKLSPGVKLTLAFVLVSAITGLVGYMGATGMSTIFSQMQSLHAKEMLGGQAAQNVAINLLSIGQHCRQLVLELHTDHKRPIIAAIEQDAKQYEVAMVDLKKSAAEGEQELIGRIEKGYPEFIRTVRETIALDAAGKRDEAVEMLDSSYEIGNDVRSIVDELIRNKQLSADTAIGAGKATYSNARLFMCVAAVVGMTLSLVLGYVLSRWFTKALVEVDQIAREVASASQQLAASAEQLSSGAQESAASLEETASSLEEMTATVHQNAGNADQANVFANGSRQTAEQGGSVVASAVRAMDEINQASKKIADIITTIDEIAFQTNLLALNAAVEAARAGEQGRGFAVVAGEVRNLAQRSATAAREIKGLIHDSVVKVEAGSALVNQSGETLGGIVASVTKVTGIVGEIATASREQASGIDQINRAVAQMDTVIQSNASQTEEMSGTAVALSDQAKQLQQVVARFNLRQAAQPVVSGTVPKAGTAKRGDRGASRPTAARRTVESQRVQELELVGARNGSHDGFEEF